MDKPVTSLGLTGTQDPQLRTDVWVVPSPEVQRPLETIETSQLHVDVPQTRRSRGGRGRGRGGTQLHERDKVRLGLGGQDTHTFTRVKLLLLLLLLFTSWKFEGNFNCR